MGILDLFKKKKKDVDEISRDTSAVSVEREVPSGEGAIAGQKTPGFQVKEMVGAEAWLKIKLASGETIAVQKDVQEGLWASQDGTKYYIEENNAYFWKEFKWVYAGEVIEKKEAPTTVEPMSVEQLSDQVRALTIEIEKIKAELDRINCKLRSIS